MNESNKHSIEQLFSLVENDIIKVDNVLEYIMASKIEKVKQMHKYKITPPNPDSKKSRWQTHYIDASGKRVSIKAQTEEELWKKLVPLYFQEKNFDKMLFSELYKEWLEYKKTITNSINTIQRHEQHYKKYFLNSKLNNKKIHLIDELLLESESNRIVRDFNLTRKEWGNIKTILKGMFEYAVRKKYLTENPMNNVKISVKFRQVVKKTGKTETYNTDELKDLNKYLDFKFSETGDTVFMAVKMNFLLGLRVGELVALKWEDWIDLNHLHIVREEIKDRVTNTYSVVEHTKTNTDRFVCLVPKAINILQKIPKESEYIFVRDNERITSRQIAYVLEKYAQDMGLKTKSTHKMRKTYASNLNAHGVPLDSIRELLGHSNLNTTLGYIYNPLTEKETYNLISQAL